MPIVNYVCEHRRFIEYATDEQLSGSERLLWYALMHIFNQRAQGRVWPDEFIRIANERVLAYSGMKFDAMSSARNRLKQRGLIDFIPGKGSEKGGAKAQSPLYKMVYFEPETANHTDKADGLGDGMGDGIRDGLGDGTGDISINYTSGKPGTENGEDEEEPAPQDDIPLQCQNTETLNESDKEYIRRSNEADEAAIAGFRMFYAPDRWNGAEAQAVARMGCAFGFSREMIMDCVRLAAENGAKAPAGYACAVMEDLSRHNVKDMQAMREYLELRNAAKGNSVFIAPEEARDRLSEMQFGPDWRKKMGMEEA